MNNLYKYNGSFYKIKENKEDEETILENIFNANDVIEYPIILLDQVSWNEVFGELYKDQWIGTADLVSMTLAMMQEASEAMNELDFKPWKQKEHNLEKYRDELADIFIFLMVCAKIAGLDADEFIKITAEKHQFNKIRSDHDRNKDQ